MKAAKRQTLPGQRLHIPFIDTTPLWDLHWLLCLFPIWWLLGAEQIVWMAGSFWVTLKLLIRQHGRIKLPLPVRLLLLFLLVILISGFFIVEPVRWITFGRNLGTYLTGLLVTVVVTNCVRSWRDVQYLLKAMFIAIGFSTFASLSGALNLWRPQFLSLMGHMLPQWVLATDYGRQLAYRTIGQPGWFIGLENYYRLNGFFLFATFHASALVYTLPLLWFAAKWARSWRRWLLWGYIGVTCVVLFFTTARIPILSLFVGGLYFALFASRQRRLHQILGALAAMALFMLMSFVFLAEDIVRRPLLVEPVTDVAATFWYARGTGSPTSRLYVYESTLLGVAERPFFGWGTERHLAGSRLPAGSHNEYLAILYRQGIIGFIVYLNLLGALWWYTRPLPYTNSPVNDFLRYGRWFFVVFLVNHISIVPVTDTTLFLILWFNLALLLAARKIA